ncbi:hypothetical protein PR048_007288 [Dryococelus australis]|uniref:Uncharacterized protein n=1 Tax=Dryococelus australis TaxID=614101 RepID=A0ABQ9IEF4_9NEOP|nr:hypothetical protein PR048_007288 [Dryococelus australis]
MSQTYEANSLKHAVTSFVCEVSVPREHSHNTFLLDFKDQPRTVVVPPGMAMSHSQSLLPAAPSTNCSHTQSISVSHIADAHTHMMPLNGYVQLDTSHPLFRQRPCRIIRSAHNQPESAYEQFTLLRESCTAPELSLCFDCSHEDYKTADKSPPQREGERERERELVYSRQLGKRIGNKNSLTHPSSPPFCIINTFAIAPLPGQRPRHVCVLSSTGLPTPRPEVMYAFAAHRLARGGVNENNAIETSEWSANRMYCVLRFHAKLMRVKLCKNGAAPESKGGENGRSPRKLTDQRHRSAKFPLAKIRSDPAVNRVRFAKGGG